MDFLTAKIKIKRLSETAHIPQKATPDSAGYDLYSDETILLPAKGYIAVSTGISMEMPSNMEAQVRPRSGLAIKHGITVLNAPGTIDADYRGEIKVLLINFSDKDFLIEKETRIAQMVFSTVSPTTLEEVDILDDTLRGNGGFGSTGNEKL
ncbi:MAG: dUTP diphosphatase [Spirochaetota bacterium]|nr:dUTP diphosphatase [Spirochaetota bacterium]